MEWVTESAKDGGAVSTQEKVTYIITDATYSGCSCAADADDDDAHSITN